MATSSGPLHHPRTLARRAWPLASALVLVACGDDDAAGAGGAGTSGGDGGATVTSASGATTTGVTAGPSSVASSASSTTTTTTTTTSATTTSGSGCIPDTCSGSSAQCGTVPDGCGGTITCGPCPGQTTCNDETNQCECLCGCTDWVKTTLLDTLSSPGFSVAVGPDGTEHAVAYDEGVADYVLFRRQPGGTFTRTPLPGAVQNQRPGVAVDPSGVVHVAYGDRYARIEVDGSLTTESIRPLSMSRVVVAGDGTVHVVGYDFYPFVSEFESTVVHSERSPEGTWTHEEIDVVDNPTETGFLLAKLAVAIPGDGALHVFYDGEPIRHAWRAPGGEWQLELFPAESDSAAVDADGGALRGLFRTSPSLQEADPVEFVQLTGESPVTTPIVEALLMTGFASIDVDGGDIHIAYGGTPEFDASSSTLRYGVRGKLDEAYAFEDVEVSNTRQTHATVLVTPDGPRVYYSKDLGGLFVASRCP